MSIFRSSLSKNTYRVLLSVICAAAVPCLLAQAPGVSGAASASTSSQAAAAPADSQSASSPAAPSVALLPDASGPLAAQAESSSKQIHILVGRSLFINTGSRLRRVYVSNPAAITSFTSSPSQIVVTAKSPGMSSLILWDEAGESQTYTVSSDIDAEGLQRSIQQAFPKDDIKVEAEQDRISLSGTVASQASSDGAAKLASLYTKDVVNALLVSQPHIKQVKLKVQMIEIDRTKLNQFGINIFSQGKNTGASSTGQFSPLLTTPATSASGSSSPITLSVSNPLNFLFYNSQLGVGMTVEDLQNRQLAQILAEPTISAINGQKASFLSGGEFPFPVIQGASSGFTSVTIQFRPYGVKLEFTPIVNDDGTIQLHVAPEVSALDYTNAVTISGYTIPAISTRRAETDVELRNGQSFAISGLLDNRTNDMLSKTPGIGDVPILGQLFRSKSINHSVVDLLVVVTPVIVDPLTEAAPAPVMPKLPVPLLDSSQFDKKMGDGKATTQPQAGMGNQQ